jgi:hypothetical protein
MDWKTRQEINKKDRIWSNLGIFCKILEGRFWRSESNFVFFLLKFIRSRGKLVNCMWKRFLAEIRSPLYIIWKDRGRLSIHTCIQSKKHLLHLLPSLFPSTAAPLSSLLLHGRWFNDDEALERSGWLGQPITAARPNGVPPGRVGFWVSRELIGMSCASRSRRGSSDDMSYVSHSSLEALGKVFICEHTLRCQQTRGSAMLIFSPLLPRDLASCWCSDLISVNTLFDDSARERLF